ncbi:unnamed protein product, partial [Amoebophrya sp. A25]
MLSVDRDGTICAFNLRKVLLEPYRGEESWQAFLFPEQKRMNHLDAVGQTRAT